MNYGQVTYYSVENVRKFFKFRLLNVLLPISEQFLRQDYLLNSYTQQEKLQVLVTYYGAAKSTIWKEMLLTHAVRPSTYSVRRFYCPNTHLKISVMSGYLHFHYTHQHIL